MQNLNTPLNWAKPGHVHISQNTGTYQRLVVPEEMLLSSPEYKGGGVVVVVVVVAATAWPSAYKIWEVERVGAKIARLMPDQSACTSRVRPPGG